MARLKLSNIVSKKNEVAQLLSSLGEKLNAQFCIQDERGKTLFGEYNETFASEYSLTVDKETVGRLKGDKNSQPIAELLSLLLHKEAEKKKLGTEVLNVYQELN